MEEIENLNYHSEGMGCGIEDRGITDRYEACEYGWNEAIEVVVEAINNMRETISEMETVDKDTNDPSKDGWIPVEERLPEKGTYVMCCFDDGAVDVLWQNWKEDKSLLYYTDIDNQIRKVIAWQPLPEPYQVNKEELDQIPAATPEFLEECKATAEKYKKELR